MATLAQLQQLAKVIADNATSTANFFHPKRLSQGTTRLSSFVKSLLSETTDDENLFAQKMGFHSLKSSAYTVTRSKVARRLLNSLWLVEFKSGSHSEFAKAVHEVNRDLFIVKTSLALGMREIAVSHARSALTLAERYELTDAELQLSIALRRNALMLGDSKEHELYSAKVNRLLDRHLCEQRMESALESVQIHFLKQGSEKPELKHRLFDILVESERGYRNYNSYSLGLIYWRVRCTYYQVSLQYEEAITTCDEALAFVESHPSLAGGTRLLEFHLYKLVCLLHLRSYERGRACAEKCISMVRKGSRNWRVVMRQLITLQMHTGRYDAARDLLLSIGPSLRLQQLPQSEVVMWKLFELYLDYIQGRTVADVELLTKIPRFQSDPAGYNAAALILQILILVEQKRYKEISERVDALLTYRKRYLRGEGNTQTAAFVKLLVALGNSRFNREELVAKTQKLVDGLNVKYADSNVLEGIQIIPYEILWDRILNSLVPRK